MRGVYRAIAFRYKNVHKFSDELIARIAKQLFDVSVHQHYAALLVKKDNSIRRGFHRQPEFFLRLFPRRYVYRNADKPRPFFAFTSFAATALTNPPQSSIG